MDIDFLISDLEGYRQLRQSLTGAGGIGSITRPGAELSLARDIRADPPRKLLRRAIARAGEAYGASIESDLKMAIQELRDRPHRLDHSLQAMRITVPKAVLWKRIKALDF